MVRSRLEYIKKGQLLTYIMAIDGFTSGIPTLSKWYWSTYIYY